MAAGNTGTCKAPFTLSRASVLAQLLSDGGDDAAVRALQSDIAALRAARHGQSRRARVPRSRRGPAARPSRSRARAVPFSGVPSRRPRRCPKTVTRSEVAVVQLLGSDRGSGGARGERRGAGAPGRGPRPPGAGALRSGRIRGELGGVRGARRSTATRSVSATRSHPASRSAHARCRTQSGRRWPAATRSTCTRASRTTAGPSFCRVTWPGSSGTGARPGTHEPATAPDRAGRPRRGRQHRSAARARPRAAPPGRGGARHDPDRGSRRPRPSA